MAAEARQSQAVEFPADGLRLRGKLWPGQGRPIVALHGWMDNAASFDVLAQCPALAQRQMLALDLYGHGCSDHKPASGSYGIWDDLRGLAQVSLQLQQQWLAGNEADKGIVLLGHSRGAIVASLLAATLPERVHSLICLDGFVAEPAPGEALPQQLRRYMDEFAAPPRQESPCAELPRLVAARQQKGAMSAQAAQRLVERNTQVRGDGRRYWRSDRRLAWASPLKLTQAQWQGVVDAIAAPTLIIAADRGLGPRLQTLPVRLGANIEVVGIAGEHHCHMEWQQADDIARRVADFIDRH